ncbi:MAG: hypothetical protein V1790_06295 [Planctomycetota bacterium]
MRLRRSCVVVLGVGFVLPPMAYAAGDIKTKEEAIASVEKQRPDLIKLSDQIWGFAETALKETKSSKVLADHAEKQGFKVLRGVANLPTAFIASYGEGRPIIAQTSSASSRVEDHCRGA